MSNLPVCSNLQPAGGIEYWYGAAPWLIRPVPLIPLWWGRVYAVALSQQPALCSDSVKGTGPPPEAGDLITVDYTGVSVATGKIYSGSRGFSFNVGDPDALVRQLCGRLRCTCMPKCMRTSMQHEQGTCWAASNIHARPKLLIALMSCCCQTYSVKPQCR